MFVTAFTAMPVGPLPTLMVAVRLFVAPSKTDTVLPAPFAV